MVRPRILADRGAENFFVDVVISWANMLHDALYKALVLERFKLTVLFPELLDQSRWCEGEHRYFAPYNRYIFAFVGNSLLWRVAYNLTLVNAGEFKSYCFLLQRKLKGKTVSLYATAFGVGATL